MRILHCWRLAPHLQNKFAVHRRSASKMVKKMMTTMMMSEAVASIQCSRLFHNDSCSDHYPNHRRHATPVRKATQTNIANLFWASLKLNNLSAPYTRSHCIQRHTDPCKRDLYSVIDTVDSAWRISTIQLQYASLEEDGALRAWFHQHLRWSSGRWNGRDDGGSGWGNKAGTNWLSWWMPQQYVKEQTTMMYEIILFHWGQIEHGHTCFT